MDLLSIMTGIMAAGAVTAIPCLSSIGKIRKNKEQQTEDRSFLGPTTRKILTAAVIVASAWGTLNSIREIQDTGSYVSIGKNRNRTTSYKDEPGTVAFDVFLNNITPAIYVIILLYIDIRGKKKDEEK